MAQRAAIVTGASSGIGFGIAKQLILAGAHVVISDIDAERVAAAVGKPYIAPEITRKYRTGDIRHCFADVARARELLGYEPQVELDPGMRDLAEWLEGQAAVDRVEDAAAELAAAGLTR